MQQPLAFADQITLTIQTPDTRHQVTYRACLQAACLWPRGYRAHVSPVTCGVRFCLAKAVLETYIVPSAAHAHRAVEAVAQDGPIEGATCCVGFIACNILGARRQQVVGTEDEREKTSSHGFVGGVVIGEWP